jgi:SAM-dependent methyltransferase
MSFATRPSRGAPGRHTLADRLDWFGDPATEEEAARFAALYDLEYAPRDLAADIDWFRGLARMTGGPVLELGCGTGRVVVPLAADGHTVVGLDRSSAMLERADRRARAVGATVRLVEGDMRNFSFDETFSLVTIPANTFLMLTPDERWESLARAREHLAIAGRLAIDVFQPDPARIAGLDGGVIRDWTRTDPETGRQVAKFSSQTANVDETTFRWWYEETDEHGAVRRWERQATLHYLYRREAELLFPEAGFQLETLHGDYDGSPVRPGSPKLLIVARRRERGAKRERRRA